MFRHKSFGPNDSMTGGTGGGMFQSVAAAPAGAFPVPYIIYFIYTFTLTSPLVPP
jgi:hypothetical protein